MPQTYFWYVNKISNPKSIGGWLMHSHCLIQMPILNEYGLTITVSFFCTYTVIFIFNTTYQMCRICHKIDFV